MRAKIVCFVTGRRLYGLLAKRKIIRAEGKYVYFASICLNRTTSKPTVVERVDFRNYNLIFVNINSCAESAITYKFIRCDSLFDPINSYFSINICGARISADFII